MQINKLYLQKDQFVVAEVAPRADCK